MEHFDGIIFHKSEPAIKQLPTNHPSFYGEGEQLNSNKIWWSWSETTGDALFLFIWEGMIQSLKSVRQGMNVWGPPY